MTIVTLDAAAMAHFRGIADYAAIYDETGHIVGYFCPLKQPPRGQDGMISSPISNEELQRRIAEPGGRPLKDILEDLEKH